MSLQLQYLLPQVKLRFGYLSLNQDNLQTPLTSASTSAADTKSEIAMPNFFCYSLMPELQMILFLRKKEVI